MPTFSSTNFLAMETVSVQTFSLIFLADDMNNLYLLFKEYNQPIE